METMAPNRYLTVPNAFTLVRLCCIPLFLYLLLGRDNQIAAAWLLGGLGATDWVDGWLARRLNQTSEFGKMFDPIADRLLFIVGIAGIIVAGVAPLWVCWLVVIREVAVGGTVADRDHLLRDEAVRRDMAGQDGDVSADVRDPRIHARLEHDHRT